MIQSDVKSALERSFLFSNIEKEVFISIVKSITLTTQMYEKGDTICAPNAFERRVGIVVSGSCQVCQMRSSEDYVLINTLTRGQSFGVISVLTDTEKFPTHIVASKQTKIAFLDANTIHSLIESNTYVAKNIISFLAERIAFLNNKVSTFSSATVEEKLAKYLISQISITGSNIIPVSKSALARNLGTGRASLYRAIESLSDKKIISSDSNNIVVINAEMLERIQK